MLGIIAQAIHLQFTVKSQERPSNGPPTVHPLIREYFINILLNSKHP